MLVKTKTSPKPVHAKHGEDVQPLSCTPGGELLVHQVNNPDSWEDLVELLHSIKFDANGAILTRQEKPIDVTLKKLSVHGTVDVGNAVTVKPVTVANMPQSIKIQEPLRVVQESIQAKIARIDFEGCGATILDKPAKIYQIHLTVCGPTMVEVVGITGQMYTDRVDMDLFPLYVQVESLRIKIREFLKVGGYVVYDV